MLSKINASQTKYGIVGIINIVKQGRLNDYINGTYGNNLSIDTPQFRATIGISEENNTLPEYWDEITQHPEQIGLFCLTAILFTHENFIEVFSNSATENMRGVLNKNDFQNVKIFTNIRGILIASGASSEESSRSDLVPYNFSKLFESGEVGKIIKKLLLDRLKKTHWTENPTGIFAEHIRDFYEQCFKYKFHLVFSLSMEQFEKWLEGEALTNESETAVSELQFTDEVEIDTHLLVSLATKPFLILSGASGTGKTLGIRKLADSINPLKHIDSSFNITFIPVEAGWKDGRNIIGYKNPFGENGEVYQPTPLVNMLLKANTELYKNIPFFVLFDEMNLSHVEMYFARFLSLIETSRHNGINNIPLLPVEDLLLLQNYYKDSYEYLNYINEAISRGGLYISSNVFFIGTVNIDETTYMFSPKVLDRSFVIERNTQKPSNILNQPLIPTDVKARLSISNINSFLLETLTIRESLNTNPEDEMILKPIIHFLDQVYELVDEFSFGYRIVVESCEYILKAKKLHATYNVNKDWLLDQNALFDEILMQKILPKIHGNRRQLTPLLKKLLELCRSGDNIRFNKSYIKLLAMEKNLNITGYCGFIC